MLATHGLARTTQEFNPCIGDRATLGSDPSTMQDCTGGHISQGGLSEIQCVLPTLSEEVDRSPWESQSDKPIDNLDLRPYLDYIETSLHQLQPRSFDMLLTARDYIIDYLERQGGWDNLRIIEQMEACSSDFLVIRKEGKLKLFPVLCRSRICPICAFYKALKLKRRLHDTIKRMRKPKLLTLTLKESNDPLDVQARRITKSFARLRRRKAFVEACKQGFWVLEYTYRPANDTWHVHIHAVIDSHFIPQDMISRMWHEITGDSFIVDIRIASPGHAGYLAKYIAKNNTYFPTDAQMSGYIKATKGLRMLGSWGKLKIEEDELLDLDDVEVIGRLSHILTGVAIGNSEDMEVLLELMATFSIDWPELEDTG